MYLLPRAFTGLIPFNLCFTLKIASLLHLSYIGVNLWPYKRPYPYERTSDQMENPIVVVILVGWCSLLAAVVYGGVIFAASEAWHTCSGEFDHTPNADQFPCYKNPNRRLRRATRHRKTQILLNNLGTPSAAKVLHNDRRFIVLEAQVHQE